MFGQETSILIVDDMKAAREHLKGILTGLKMTNMTEAEDGQDALEQLKTLYGLQMPVQLVISDWTMPKMTGLELLTQMRTSAEFRSVPFLMVTAEGESSSVIKAVQAGVSDYIVKPYDSEMLWKKLASVWKRHNAGR